MKSKTEIKVGFWRASPAPGREQLNFRRITCPELFRTQPLTSAMVHSITS